ncbi:hypothetical protein ACFYT4_32415 [Streptomyces sp. NPDC004609]|uniref:hypothetical protein n=1 Tax=Streptomyces sp. NPDC004609 TaxID=3364704 RepID=UPI003679F121
MSAHTPSPSPARDRADSRLPWWALALPLLAFAVLLWGSLPGEALAVGESAGSRSGGTEPVVGRLLEYLHHLLTR